MAPIDRIRRGTKFPIVEAYGFPYDSKASGALQTWADETCPFAGGKCEKKIQYRMGYCSVLYAAEWDDGIPQPYAVCDHRLDGEPIGWAVNDHFGASDIRLVPEVTATTKPKLNVDYMAYRDDPGALDGVDLIAIEAQAIDLRGGGVGPAWRAWEDNRLLEWRSYYTEEAARKGRRDTVDYGVNTGNVYKRLGTQVAVKGEYLKQVHVPFYVITQHRILRQLRTRVNFQTVPSDDQWDITFASFEYLGTNEPDGKLTFGFVEAVRTTLALYLTALTQSSGASQFLRADLIEKVKRKAVNSSGKSRRLSQRPLFD